MGFRSPLFILGISAAAITVQGGFQTPIPALNIGATPATLQGGFITPIPVLNIGSDGISITPDVTTQGGGSSTYRTVEVPGYKVTAKQLAQIKREDEELITIILMIGENL